VKLYYSRGACSLTPHILLHETDLPFTLERMDSATHRTEHDVDYYTVNPKGYVPLLELDDGSHLSEVAVILQYIADRQPGTLAPEVGIGWNSVPSLNAYLKFKTSAAPRY